MVKNLKALRLERGVSQQQLADAIFVTQPSIHKYETQNIEPEIAILIRMAQPVKKGRIMRPFLLY